MPLIDTCCKNQSSALSIVVSWRYWPDWHFPFLLVSFAPRSIMLFTHTGGNTMQWICAIFRSAHKPYLVTYHYQQSKQCTQQLYHGIIGQIGTSPFFVCRLLLQA